MSLKISIARENDYREEIVNYYNSILNGRLLSLNLSCTNDTDILSFISFYDINVPYFNNCCSWLKIGEISRSNYNGKDFQFINLLTNNGESIKINFSQFIYEMSTSPEVFATSDFERTLHICSIDGRKIDPSSFFSANKGKNLLYIYCYPAVTAFGQEKLCYKFAFENISASYLRNYIRDIQISVLQRCIMDPRANTPGTTLKIEVEGTANSRPSYMHNVKGKITDDFAVNIFESDFKTKFLDKLKELKQ